jgi:hypothetical protein
MQPVDDVLVALLEVSLPDGRIPVFFGANALGGDHHPMSRRDGLDPPEERAGAERVPAEQVVGEALQVEVRLDPRQGEDRLDLGREGQRVGRPGDEQRLDPQPVPGQEERGRQVVPDGEGEHAVQPVQAPGAPSIVGVKDHLRVGSGLEGVARPLELRAKLPMVVDLAVEHDPCGAGGVGDGLVAPFGVDDGQPLAGHPRRAPTEDSCRVGPAMGQRGVHRLQEPLLHLAIRLEVEDAGDPTHADRP